MEGDEIVSKVESITDELSKSILSQFGLNNDAGYCDLSPEQVNIVLLAIAQTVIPYLRAVGPRNCDGFLAFLKLESDEEFQEQICRAVVGPKSKLH